MFSERRIRYSLGKTINIGNFESIRIDYSEEVLVNEGIDMDEARYRLKEIVKEELQKEIEELTPKKNKLRRGTAPSEESE